MPKKSKNLPFQEARKIAQDHLLPSRDAYWEWWMFNRPKKLPKYPNRAYQKEWVSWNDFLGNENEFNAIPKKYRPYEEALVYIHGLKLNSYVEWLQYVKNNTLPEDIPSSPWHAYDQWISWRHWLGNRPTEKVESSRVIETTTVLYFVQPHKYPGNIFRVGVDRGGKSSLEDKQREQNNFNIVKVFKLEEGYDWNSVVNMYSQPWSEDPRYTLIPNIHELLFEINLEWI